MPCHEMSDGILAKGRLSSIFSWYNYDAMTCMKWQLEAVRLGGTYYLVYLVYLMYLVYIVCTWCTCCCSLRKTKEVRARVLAHESWN